MRRISLWPFIILYQILQYRCDGNNQSNSSNRGKITHRNVLFIMVDDLRPEIGAYIDSHNSPPLNSLIRTPNIDTLANQSILFKRAYVQEAICAPSRASILTGRRPDTTDVHTFVHFRDTWAKSFTTLPQYFKNNGYHSIGLGKIFHDGSPKFDDPVSWTEPFFRGEDNHASRQRFMDAIDDEHVKLSPLKDEQVADRAIKYIKRFSEERRKPDSKPFFLAVGFKRPHYPLVFPKSYLNVYPQEDITMPENMYIPKNFPKVAWSNIDFLKDYDDAKALKISRFFNTTIPKNLTLAIRRYYYAAVTYIDDRIGRVMTELKRTGLDKETVVFFMSDHGFHLGENGEWSKNSLFELATWTPLLFRIPGVTDKGIICNELVEFVDIFPTVLESVGHKIPQRCPPISKTIQLCVEGESLIPLISKPNQPTKNAAFSQTMRAPKLHGYSIRTKYYRYNEWVYISKNSSGFVTPKWEKPIAVELYDHEKDPKENNNVASESEYADIREQLCKRLHSGWRKAIVQEATESGGDIDKQSSRDTAVNVEIQSDNKHARTEEEIPGELRQYDNASLSDEDNSGITDINSRRGKLCRINDGYLCSRHSSQPIIKFAFSFELILIVILIMGLFVLCLRKGKRFLARKS